MIKMSLWDESIVKAVEKVSPSVVAVGSLRIVHDYFLQPIPVTGLGSGVIVREDGYILTNYHVVGGVEHVEVALSRGKVLKGELIGVDRRTDLALLKINMKNLPVAVLGDSSKLKVGHIVLAIGNPLGLLGEPTVTIGVVSALRRTIKSERGVFEDMIQTDAHINPGNSGGPLINLNGEVIGINTAIIPFAQGIGFAIPVNTAKKVVNDLISYGRVLRPWIGVQGVDINEKVAEYYGLPVSRGCLVIDVAPNGPAGYHGIQPGDIITAVSGRNIDCMEELKSAVEMLNIGDVIELTIIRRDKILNIPVELSY